MGLDVVGRGLGWIWMDVYGFGKGLGWLAGCLAGWPAGRRGGGGKPGHAGSPGTLQDSDPAHFAFGQCFHDRNEFRRKAIHAGKLAKALRL